MEELVKSLLGEIGESNDLDQDRQVEWVGSGWPTRSRL